MTSPSDHQKAYPSGRLAAKIAAGDFTEDQTQMVAAKRLDELIENLCRRQSQNWMKTFLRPPQPVKGLYFYGGVGRGKTMLMDMFVNSLPHHTATNSLAVTLSRFYGFGSGQHPRRPPI